MKEAEGVKTSLLFVPLLGGEMEIYMTEKGICEAGGIYFANITEGLEDYDYEILQMKAGEAEVFLNSLLDENGENRAYADFYYGKLEAESQARVDEMLDEAVCGYLHDLKAKTEELFVPLTRELLSLFVQLNEQEVLFSSFYFLKYPCTIWGNYNKQYVVFRNKGVPLHKV